MEGDTGTLICLDCDEPLLFAFTDTSGVGAHKRGDSFNTIPDTHHYLCLECAKAWKRRLSGPLTPDVVGDLAFFSCRHEACGRPLTLAGPLNAPPVDLACAEGHPHQVVRDESGALRLETRRTP